MVRFSSLLGGAAALGAFYLSAAAANATTYDLKSDWSNTNNPNGVWTYLAGTEVLPSLNGADWGGYGFGPGFANSASMGYGFAPVIFQYNGSAPQSVDASAGDIVAHTQTNDSNAGAGDFSVEFTSPAAGTATISGEVWYAHVGVDRWQDWTVSVGGTVLASGTLEGPANGSSTPETFDLTGLTLAANEVAQLKIVLTSGGTQTDGALVGLDMNVALTSTVPEASTWAMMAAGFAGLGLLGSLGGARRRAVSSQP